MATNSITLTLELKDNGTIKAKTSDTKELTKQLTLAQKAAKDLVNSRSASSAKDRSEAYGVQRSTVGTGAASRDFAKEAQGLGGLVRVYATFAANVFAATAAFTALSNAMDTSNLVKGLDQLGAASGRNLGTLAKDVVKATDNAVSLREAMTSVAQASAAGMSNKDIIRLAEGAKKAAQALGFDMSDALSRLSRGITKLEPELLDELGIFIRVDKASQDFAKSIGKPVSALTDLEKRSAFAAAALSQVEKKFGEVKIDSNPYTQLLAALKNISTQGLELVNTVLAPLVSFLAKSPTALAAGLTLISTVLLKQAIPAITSFRQNMRDAANEAKQRAVEIDESFKAMKGLASQQVENKLKAAVKREADAAVAAMNIAQETLSRGLKIGSVTIANLNKKFKEGTLDNSDLNKALSQAARFESGAANATNTYTPEQRKANIEKAAAIRNYVEQLRAAKIAQDELTRAEDKNRAQLQQKAGMFSQEGKLNMIRARAEASAKRSEIVATAADNSAFVGPVAAFKSLRAQINLAEGSLGTFGKTATYVRGSIAVLGAAASTTLSAFGPLVMIIGLVAAAVSGLVSVLKTNTKEVEATTAAIDRLTESSDGVVRTMEYMARLDPFERMSAASISARASAFGELAASIDTAVIAAAKEVNSRGTFDKIFNWTASLIGKDTETEISEAVADSLIRAIKLAQDSPELKKGLPALLELAGGADATSKTIAKKLKADPSGLEATAKLLKSQSAAAAKAAEVNTTLVDSIKSLSKARTEALATFAITDPSIKLGQEMVKSAYAMETALKATDVSVSAISDAAKELASSGLFSNEQINQLDSYGDKLKTISGSYGDNQREAAKLELTLASLQEQQKKLQSQQGARFGNTPAYKARQAGVAGDIDRTQTALDAVNAKLSRQKTELASVVNGMQPLVSKAFEAGIDRVAVGIDASFARAALTVEKAKAAGLSGTTAGLKKETELAKKELDIQISLIDTMITLQQAVIKSALATDKNTLVTKINNESNPEIRAAYRKQLDTVEAQDRVASSSGNTVRTLQKEFNAKDASEETKSALKGMLTYATQSASLNAQKAEKNAQKAAENTKLEYAIIEKQAADRVKANDALQQEIDNKKSLLSQDKELNAIADSTYATRLAILDTQQRELEYTNTIIGLMAKYEEVLKASNGNANAEGVQEIVRNITAATAAFSSKTTIANKATDIAKTKALQAETEKNAAAASLMSLTVDKEKYDVELSTYNLRAQQLDINKENLVVDDDAYAAAKARVNLQIVEVKAMKDKLELTTSIATRQRALDVRSAEASKANDPVILKQIADEQAQINVEREYGISAIDRATEAEKRGIEATIMHNSQTKILQDSIVGAADTLTDAFFDATQSGKFNFTDMINSMLLDLAKLEFKAGAMKILKGGAEGDGLINLLTSGITSFFGSSSTGGGMPNMPFGGLTQANGGAWSNGVQKFAKGGSFTNSVVNSPTLFKFAKGTGLMGEAGPEAIMPLKRDAQGRLGVSHDGNNGGTSVVVNNYTSEKATTKETVDSRGKKRVEVTIGDMVAGEMGRVGSSTQQSMKATYGSQPQLIRR